MKDEYDFSKAERGKFYRADATLNLPVYIDDDVREFVERIAASRGCDVSTVVNDLLKCTANLAKVLTT